MAQEPTTQCSQCGKSFPATVKICPNDGTVLEHERATTTQVGAVLDGKYRLDAFLSQGGMGAVYRATHVMLNKRVAVKLINPELVTSSEIVRRFQREARAATILSHPNIVSVYDLGQTAEGTLYIAMEFVDGPSLKSVIESGGPIPAARTLTIMRQLASALSLAHRHGIIHRDLKPHNVMLARTEDGQQVAKLVDFGIAKTFDEGTQLTMAGFSPGTPQYMAPEQAEGLAVDARSDLYSLGIVLYEMLAGDVPFNAATTTAVLVKQVKEAPLPPSVKNPHVSISPGLEAITLRCLAKNPDDRFQTADDLGAALAEEAASFAASASAIEATIAMPVVGAAAVASMAARDATTMPAAAARPTSTPATTAVSTASASASSPTSAATQALQQPTAARASSDTRPTAPGAPAGPVAVAPDVVAASMSKKAGVNPVFVGVLLLMAVGAMVLAYLNYQSGTPAESARLPQAAAAPPVAAAPAASPAMAPQSATTSAQSASATPSEAPAASSTAAQPSGQTPPSSSPAESTSQTNPSQTSAAATPRAAAPQRSAAGLTATGSPSSAQRNSASSVAGAAPVARGNRASAASAATAATASAVVLTPSAPAEATPAQAPGPGPARGEQRARQAPETIPEIPNVFFRCTGAQAVCAPLRTAVMDALDKGGLINVRILGRADIVIEATAVILQERVERQFGTTFQVRNYSIELSGEAPRTGEAVAMPPSTTLSFDPQFGSERAEEKARVVASDVVDRVKAFVRRKRGG